MGDRCSVEVLCRKDDAKRFEALDFVQAEWGEQPDHLAHMFEEQANYGAASDLQALADDGVVFVGASGVRNEASAAVFASDGKKFLSVNSLSDTIDSKPIAEIDADGNADPGTLKAITRYFATLKAAKKKLGIV